MRNTAILIFDEVEVLDFAGPFEVFSVAGRRSGLEPFSVYTVAERAAPVIARNGLSINPRYAIADCPPPALLVVPGGYGTRREMKNLVLLEWLTAVSRRAEFTLSVCTGALMLGAAGLLDGLVATTHHGAIGELRAVAPATEVRPDTRIADNGHIILSAGVSAGIDMSLHVVSRLMGIGHARETARYMEYEGDWERLLRSAAVA